MNKQLLLTFVLLFAFFAIGEAREVSVCSPDGSICISVIDSPTLQYTLSVDGRTAVKTSKIAVVTDLKSGTFKIGKVSRSSVSQTINTLNYTKSEITDCYNQAVLDLKGFELIVRAYDDGCAWRFVSKSRKPFKVYNETWEVSLPENSPMWINYSNVKSDSIQAQFGSSQENVYAYSRICDWDAKRIAVTPLLIEQNVNLTLSEADVIDYPGLYFCNADGSQKLNALFPPVPDGFSLKDAGITKNIIEKVTSVRDYIADCPAGFTFPWRIIGVNRSQSSLLESDMVQRLASPAAECDWSWVRPGKVAWDWWCGLKLDGVSFKSGFNTQTYKYFIDFAAEYGLEYVIMDGGWSVREAADLMQVVPGLDLEEIVSYGKSKGVGIILWAGFAPFRDSMEEVCRHYAAMGVKGFKVDFHNRDDQTMMRYYREAAQTCAKHKLLIEFHGCSKPTGLQRTYPNVINFEAVYGMEMTKFAEPVPADFVKNEVTMPFVRMYAGPVDYTPGAMRNATKTDFRYIRDEPMSQGTRCRQIAQYIVFFAPLQMLCDSPTTYQKESECTEFISKIPVVWDETIAIEGKVGEYLALARRKGDTWYLAAMNGWTALSKEISLSFLPAGHYSIEEMRDGANSSAVATDYLQVSSSVRSTDNVKINLAPGGGYAAIIRPLR